MLGRVRLDGHLRRLLRPLMSVRHAHLRPRGSHPGASRLSLHYGEAPPCVAGCEGLWALCRRCMTRACGSGTPDVLASGRWAAWCSVAWARRGTVRSVRRASERGFARLAHPVAAKGRSRATFANVRSAGPGASKVGGTRSCLAMAAPAVECRGLRTARWLAASAADAYARVDQGAVKAFDCAVGREREQGPLSVRIS